MTSAPRHGDPALSLPTLGTGDAFRGYAVFTGPLPCSDSSALSWTSLILPTPHMGAKDKGCQAVPLLGPGREAKRQVDCLRHMQGVTSAVRRLLGTPQGRKATGKNVHSADLAPSPLSLFPEAQRGAQGSRVGGGVEARWVVRAPLRTCLWELTDRPRAWPGPLSTSPFPTMDLSVLP